MIKLLLHTDSITDRGTSTAVHEYATWLENRGFEVTWSYSKNSSSNDLSAIRYFENFHNLEPYEEFKDYAEAKSREIDWAYFLKKGNNDEKLVPRIENNVHVVFNYYEPHGTRYFYISKWLANYASRQANLLVPKKIRRYIPNPFVDMDYVPHCVDMPPARESMRPSWGIPEEARVCIRYGGFNTFDIEWVKESVIEVLNQNPDFFFVGINTERFTNHPRAIFLPPILNVQEKSDALASADVFLHARTQGESFGLAILEARQLGVKTLAWHGGRDLNHHNLIARECLYHSQSDLISKLTHVDRNLVHRTPSLRAEKFRPYHVMPEFEVKLGLSK